MLLISFFLLPQCTSVFLKDGLQIVIFGSLLALLFSEYPTHLRGNTVYKPPQPLVFLFQCQHFYLLLYAFFAVDLFLQALVVYVQIKCGYFCSKNRVCLLMPTTPLLPVVCSQRVAIQGTMRSASFWQLGALPFRWFCWGVLYSIGRQCWFMWSCAWMRSSRRRLSEEGIGNISG